MSSAALKDGAFNPTELLIPGWRGEGLFSKNTVKIKNLLLLLHQDVKAQFASGNNFNKSKKLAIYSDFLAFADRNSLLFDGIENYADFWRCLVEGHPGHQAQLDCFLIFMPSECQLSIY